MGSFSITLPLILNAVVGIDAGAPGAGEDGSGHDVDVHGRVVVNSLEPCGAGGAKFSRFNKDAEETTGS